MKKSLLILAAMLCLGISINAQDNIYKVQGVENGIIIASIIFVNQEKGEVVIGFMNNTKKHINIIFNVSSNSNNYYSGKVLVHPMGVTHKKVIIKTLTKCMDDIDCPIKVSLTAHSDSK